MATVPNPVDTKVIKESSTRHNVAIWNNYDTCGTMTRADVGVAETADLDNIFTETSSAHLGKTTARYRDMESLLVTQMELKTCGGRQYGLYDWLMSGAKSMGSNVTERKVAGGVSEIEPFILAAQKDVIKDDYWLVSHILNYQYKYETHATPESSSAPVNTAITALNGGTGFTATAASGHVIIRVSPAGNNPAAVGYFPVGSVVNLFAKGGGDPTSPAFRIALKVVEAVTDDPVTAIELLCTFQGGWGAGVDITPTTMGVTLGAGKVLSLISKFQSPASGTGLGSKAVLTIGANNVNDFESWCSNRPALNTLKHVPFWYQTSRHTLCVSEFYKEWLERMMRTNAYFAKFGDVSLAERNAQLGLQFQKEWCNSFFFGQPISTNQKISLYKDLDVIPAVSTSNNDWNGGAGNDIEGAPIGYRANALGVYRQLADTGRVQDKGGGVFNLKQFIETDLFNLVRSRKDQGKPADSIDVFTDSKTAKRIFDAMVTYYKNESGSMLNLRYDVTNQNIANLGFYADSYRLHYPAGVTMNVITNEFFDDLVTTHYNAEVAGADTNAATAAEARGSMGRFLMVLDLGGGIYPGIIASNRVVHKTGDLADLAKSDSSYSCVMNNPTKETTLNSLTWTAIVDCPSDNLIIENFQDDAHTIV